MLELRNVSYKRGDEYVLRAVSLQVGAGECWHIAGTNGAGKSTLLKLIAGLLIPHDGVIVWCGVKQILYLGHHNNLQGSLTVWQNLRYLGWLLNPMVSDDEIRCSLEYWQIDELRDVLCRELSAGQLQRVSLARMVLGVNKAVWLLDEPTINLDYSSRLLLQDLCRRHIGGGGGLLLASHTATIAEFTVTARYNLERN